MKPGVIIIPRGPRNPNPVSPMAPRRRPPSDAGPVLFQYPGYFGTKSFCMIEVLRKGDRKAVVIATEHADNPGTSITNRVEEIASRVCAQYLINPADLVWIEHYPERGDRRDPLPEVFDRVTFKNPLSFQGPQWKRLTPAEVFALRTEATA